MRRKLRSAFFLRLRSLKIPLLVTWLKCLIILKVSKFHQNWKTKSRVIFKSDFQYQDSTKWWCHQWLGLNLSKPTSFLGTIPKASETKFHQIRITKLKVIHVQIPASKWEKTKKWGKKFGLHNGAIRRLYIGAGFRDYRSKQERLQIGEALEISNRDKKITNRGWDFKLEQRDFKSGKRLQIGTRGISNRGRDYKLLQNKLKRIFQNMSERLQFLWIEQPKGQTRWNKRETGLNQTTLQLCTLYGTWLLLL